MTTEPATNEIECSWCFYGERQSFVPAEHAVLFACVREHMAAIRICAECARDRAAVGELFRCRECTDAGVDEEAAVMRITLVTTRADWMDRVKSGRIRMLIR